MANLLQAINAYRPKLVLGKSVQSKELVEYISDRTGLNRGDIQLALSELSDSVTFFNKQGRGVKLEGLGTYLPSIDTKGKLSVSHRLDKEIKNSLNVPQAFKGDISNKENIGRTNDEFTQLWNEAHPEDPVV